MTLNDDVCQMVYVHQDAVEQVRKGMPSKETIRDLSELFKVLGDGSRLRILFALSVHELCVCDLAALLDISPSAASHQLRILRASKIVEYRKEGKNVFYSLNDGHVSNLIREGAEHVCEGREVSYDGNIEPYYG